MTHTRIPLEEGNHALVQLADVEVPAPFWPVTGRGVRMLLSSRKARMSPDQADALALVLLKNAALARAADAMSKNVLDTIEGAIKERRSLLATARKPTTMLATARKPTAVQRAYTRPGARSARRSRAT